MRIVRLLFVVGLAAVVVGWGVTYLIAGVALYNREQISDEASWPIAIGTLLLYFGSSIVSLLLLGISCIAISVARIRRSEQFKQSDWLRLSISTVVCIGIIAIVPWPRPI